MLQARDRDGAARGGAKFSQSLPFATPEHGKSYKALRNSVESTNGFLKDSAFETIGNPQRRRVRGVAAQSVLVAFRLLAGNLRKIDSFMKQQSKAQAEETGRRQPRRRRRTTKPIQKWLDDFSAPGATGRAPPDR